MSSQCGSGDLSSALGECGHNVTSNVCTCLWVQNGFHSKHSDHRVLLCVVCSQACVPPAFDLLSSCTSLRVRMAGIFLQMVKHCSFRKENGREGRKEFKLHFTVHTWRSVDNFMESVLSIHLTWILDSKLWWVLKLELQSPFPTEPSHRPNFPSSHSVLGGFLSLDRKSVV